MIGKTLGHYQITNQIGKGCREMIRDSKFDIRD